MVDIVISEFMDQAAFKEAAKEHTLLYDPQLFSQADRLKELLLEACGLVVRNRTQVTKELISGAPKLKVIGRLGVGLDNIDLTACEHQGVKVCPATGANDNAVAEWVIASILFLMRNAFQCGDLVLDGQWPRNQSMGNEIGGKTLGLVGFGQIARATARMAKALNMTVTAFDPFVPPEDACWQGLIRAGELNELLKAADAVSLHIPLSDTTWHMIDADALMCMKKGAILVNAARGGVLDETALVGAMKSGQIKGAALDVFETEPLSAKAATQFVDLPNLILTPHIAGVTIESNQRVSRVTMDNVCRVLESGK